MKFHKPEPAPDIQQSHLLMERVADNIVPRVKRSMHTRYLVEFKLEQGLPVLRFMTSSAGGAVFTIKRRPGGYLWAPPGQVHRTILESKHQEVVDYTTVIRRHISRTAITDPSTKHLLLRQAAYGNHGYIVRLIMRSAQALTQELLQHSLTPSGEKEVKPNLVNGLWNNMARDHLLNPNVMEAAKRFNVQLTVQSHNFILRNISLFKENPDHQLAQKALRYAVKSLLNRMPSTPIRSHQDLQDTVGHILEIPAHQRKYLPAALQNIDIYHPTRGPATILATCRALWDIGADVSDPNIQRLGYFAPEHRRYSVAGNELWQKWLQALREYQQHPLSLNLYNTRETLNREVGYPGTPGYREVEKPPPPSETLEQPLIDHINGPAKEAVTALLPHWTPCKISLDGEDLVFRIITSPEGGTAVTFKKRPDGTISIDCPSDPDWKYIHLDAGHLTKLLVNNVAQLLLEHTAHALPAPTAAAATYDNSLQKTCAAARKTAKAIAEALVTTKNPKDLTHLVSRTNRTLKTKLIDRRAIATVLSLFSAQDTHAPSSDWSNMNNYNTVVLNREIFSGMMKTGQQAPLRAHCLEFLRQADSHRVFQHRGEIIREIKDRLKLDPPQWRYFCKAARIRSVSDLLPMNIPRMAMACQALVDANRPQAHPQQLHQIWQRQHDHEAFHKAAWRHGDPWKAWTGLLNQYLAPSEIPRSAEDLNLITDALRHHVQNQLPWGPGNWAILLTRSERWHVENFQRHGRGRYYALPKEGQDASWTSLVDLVNIDGLSFAPVTNGPRLAFLGSRMGNCLATYWSSCNQGISRIFTATIQRQPPCSGTAGQQPRPLGSGASAGTSREEPGQGHICCNQQACQGLPSGIR